MLIAALHSRSPQIALAGRLVFLNWALSLQLWLVSAWLPLLAGYLIIDAVTAAIFFRMSRGRWFPVPLFLLHAALMVCHAGSVFVEEQESFWVQVLLNRTLDIELIYITGCALFRIAVANRAGNIRGA